MEPVDLEPYRKAIKDRICTFCLDRRHDGSCGRPKDRPCALESHLGTLVETVVGVGEDAQVGDYVAALRTDLCPTCKQDEEGYCPRREIVHCALDAYVLPVIDVIHEVAQEQGDRPG